MAAHAVTRSNVRSGKWLSDLLEISVKLTGAIGESSDAVCEKPLPCNDNIAGQSVGAFEHTIEEPAPSDACPGTTVA